MKLNALIFSFGLVAPLCGVCQQGAAQTAFCDISSMVVPLGPNFDPVNYGNCEIPGTTCDKPPQSGGSVPVTTVELADIVAAFNIAPLFFQQELCSLDKIYIDTDPSSTNPSVWGIRERLHKNSHTGKQSKHIGISAKLWSSIGSNPPYAFYENTILSLLLNPLQSQSVTAWMNPPQLSYTAVPDPAPSSAPSTPNAVAILAILAHEMGHILWWDKNVGTRTCVKASQSRFSNYSWPSNQVAHGFHRLGQQDKKNRTTDRPDKDDVLLDLNYDNPPGSGNYSDAVADLQTMYLSGNWASLFATVSADEDFIETYKLWVLTNTNNTDPITALHIQIPSLSAIDILSRFNNAKTKLYAKAQWIQNCLSWP